MRVRSILAGAAALGVLLTACGDDGGDAATTTTAPAGARATTEPLTSTPEELALGELLVTAEDLGEGFAAEPYRVEHQTGPCGYDLDTDYPYDLIAGTVLVEEDRELFVRHELRTYDDEAIAVATFGVNREALSCGASTDLSGLALGEVTDVAAEVGTEGFLVPFTVEELGYEGAYVVVRIGAAVSTYYFQGPSDGEEGPDPLAVVAANVETLQAELG